MQLAFVVSGEDVFESVVRPEKLAGMLKKEGYEGCVLIDSDLSSFPEWFYFFEEYDLAVFPGVREDDRYVVARNAEELRALVRYSNRLDELSADLLVLEGLPANLDEKGLVWEIRYHNQGEKPLLNAYRTAGDLEPLTADYSPLSEEAYKKKITSQLSEIFSHFSPLDSPLVEPQVFPVRSSVDDLRKRAMESLRERGFQEHREYIGRLDRELSVVSEKGYCDYFATTAEVVDIAVNKGFWMGPGRGSAVGSLLVWALGITHVDPVKHELFFERFLNTYRADFPDIDLDIEDNARQEMIGELSNRFGKNHVALVQTKARFSFKSAARALGKKMRLSEREISELISHGESARVLKGPRDTSKMRSLLKWARAFEGLYSGISTHAAGVILSAQDIREVIPVRSQDGLLVSRWGMRALELVGWQKLDLLGLRNLRLLKELLDDSPPWNRIPDEPEPLRLLSSGFTTSIFQVESTDATRIARKMRPCNLGDIALTIALNRPGPLRSGIAEKLVKKRAEKEAGVESSEGTSSSLEETFGLIVYQEQLIKMFVEKLGLMADEAELLRRAISKKDRMMFDEAVKSINMSKTNLSAEEVKGVIETARTFAEYTFNKSHSFGYALITFWMAYCKAKYPARFFRQILPGLSMPLRKRAAAEARELGLGFSLFDSEEGRDVKISPEEILPIGKAAELVSVKPSEETFHAFVLKNKRLLNPRSLENLIRIGFLDCFGFRKEMLKQMKEALAGVDPSLRSVLKVFGYKQEEAIERDDEKAWERAAMENALIGFNLTEFDTEVPDSDICDTTITRAIARLDTGIAPFASFACAGKHYLTDGKTIVDAFEKPPEKGLALFRSGRLSSGQYIESDERCEVVRTYDHPLSEDCMKRCSASNILRIKIGDHYITVGGARAADVPPDRIEVSKK